VPVCHPGTPTASGSVTDQGWLSEPVKAVCKGESGALNGAFLGGVREQTFGSNVPSTGARFSVFARYLAEVKRLLYGNPLRAS